MLVLALMGCVSRQTHLAQTLEAGWGDRVWASTRSKQRVELYDTVWAATDVTVAMEVVPIEAFGIPPRGYGVSWWMIGVGFDRRRGVTPTLKLKASFDTLETCTTCDPAWIRNQMASPYLSPERSSGGGGGRRRRGRLGRLLGGLADVGKLVGSIVLMPVAFATDVGLAMTGLSTTKQAPFKPFGLTRFTWSAMTGQTLGGPATVQAVGAAPDVGFSCTHDGPCSGSLVVKGDQPPTSVELRIELANHLSRTVHLPLDGATLEESLAAVVPSDGITLVLTEGTP